MTNLVIRWPDEAAESVRAARGRLAIAFDELERIPFAERLDRVAAIVEAWTRTDSPWRRELSQQLEAETPFHPATLAEGIESAFAAWHPNEFVACARSELAADHNRRRLAPFECVSVLAGGSIPMPTILQTLLPLVLGSPVLLRETSKDPVTGSVLARCLADLDPELSRAVELVRFPSEDSEALDAFLESPCVVATGADETLASLRRKLPPAVRFVQYGHRFSIAILGPESLSHPADLDRALAGLALDLLRWDQLGCLSPVEIYLVGLESAARIEIAERLAAAIGERARSMPRGDYRVEELALHAAERSEARMRAAVVDTARCFEGADWTLTLESDAAPRVAPLLRFARLKPTASLAQLNQVLRPVSGSLSTACSFGFGADASHKPAGASPEAPMQSASDALFRALTRFGVSRICEPGTMQTPPIDWPHDGMPVFQPIARFGQWM